MHGLRRNAERRRGRHATASATIARLAQYSRAHLLRAPLFRAQLAQLARCALVATIALLAGCSLVRFAYDNLDFFAMRYVNQYMDLSDSQEAEFRPRLDSALKAHRREGLPGIVQTFRLVETHAEDGLTSDELDEITTAAVAVYTDVTSRVITLVSPTLNTLSQEQLAHLKEAVDERNEEFAERFGVGQSREARVALRVERMSENLEEWAGSVSESQTALLLKIANGSPDFVDAWRTYRAEKQAALYALIEKRASSTEIVALLRQWWIDQDDLGAASYLRSADTRTRLSQSLLAIDASMSSAQRAHFVEKVRELRESLQSALP